jgi:hypothetical protein
MERCADGVTTWQKLRTALDAAEHAEVGARDRARAAARAVTAAWASPEHCRSAAERAAMNPKSEREAQADLLRDIFGNPFRAPSIDLAWLTWNDGCVAAMARSIYDQRRFAEMPILADALEEAGCTDPDMLAHARRRQAHVRGCWLLDCLLGAPLVEEPSASVSRWTIEETCEGQGQFVRQSACPGHFARVTLRIDPMLQSGPVVFLNAAPANVNVQPWLGAIASGVRQALRERAESERMELRGMRITLIEIVEHAVDSTPRAFERAASLALTEALAQTCLVPS